MQSVISELSTVNVCIYFSSLCHFTWLLVELKMCVHVCLCLVLLCSCSSTTQWRDWGQVLEAWMISNPTLSLPEWTGPNRRCALWDGGNKSCMLGNWLSRMNSFQTGHTNTYTVNTDNAFLHTSPFLCFCMEFAKKQYYLPCTLLISLSHRGFTV